MSWHPPECQLTDKPPQALERALITGTRKCPRCRHRKQTKLPCHTRVRQEFPKLVMTSRSRRELLVLKEICAPSIRHMFFWNPLGALCSFVSFAVAAGPAFGPKLSSRGPPKRPTPGPCAKRSKSFPLHTILHQACRQCYFLASRATGLQPVLGLPFHSSGLQPATRPEAP